MTLMFNKYQNLLSLDLSKFNTSNVKIMKEMFYKCLNLTSLDLSNFDTSKVTIMTSMFKECSALLFLIYHLLIHQMLNIWIICSLDAQI